MAIVPALLPTPAEFLAGAPAFTVLIVANNPDGTPNMGAIVAVAAVNPQEFKTGTYGWTGQISTQVGGLKVTGATQLFVSKSKEAPRTRPVAAPATEQA